MPVRKRKARTLPVAYTKRRAGTIVLKRWRGSVRRMAPRGRVNKNMHAYVRWANPLDIGISQADGQTKTGSITFNLQAVTGYSELTALYDRYMITGVKCLVQLITNPDATNITNSGSQSNPNNIYPKFWYCPDYDDSSPEILSDLKQRSKSKCFVLRPNKTFKIWVKPAILGQVYRTSVTTAYDPMWNKYIDMGQSDVPHYGLKYVIDALGTTPAATIGGYYIRIEFKYYLRCKDVR